MDELDALAIHVSRLRAEGQHLDALTEFFGCSEPDQNKELLVLRRAFRQRSRLI